MSCQSRSRINTTCAVSLAMRVASFIDTEIPINSALAKAQAAGLSIFQFQPRSRGALAHVELAAEVAERLGLDAATAVAPTP